MCTSSLFTIKFNLKRNGLFEALTFCRIEKLGKQRIIFEKHDQEKQEYLTILIYFFLNFKSSISEPIFV